MSYRPYVLAAVWVLAAYAFLTWPLSSAAQTQATIRFVQDNYSVPSTPQAIVTVNFPAAQSAGNLNVVIVGWNDSTANVTSVTDSTGNVYSLAVGPTVRAGQASQAIYFAPNIAAAAANSNIVTVHFSSAAVYPDVRVLEYSGLDPVSPLLAVTASSGSSATSSSGTRRIRSERAPGRRQYRGEHDQGSRHRLHQPRDHQSRRGHRRGSGGERGRQLQRHRAPVFRRILGHRRKLAAFKSQTLGSNTPRRSRTFRLR